MGYDHRYLGWHQFSQYCNKLKALGIEVQLLPSEIREPRGMHKDYEEDRKEDLFNRRKLRRAKYITSEGTEMMIEEWLAVDYQDCDGTSVIGLLVYPKGFRPKVITQVI